MFKEFNNIQVFFITKSAKDGSEIYLFFCI